MSLRQYVLTEWLTGQVIAWTRLGECRTDRLPAPGSRHGSPARRSRGGSARSRAGATSSSRTGCSPRCASSASRPPSSARSASSPTTRRPRPHQLAAYGMQAVGGFLPVLLHDPDHDPMPEVDAFIDACLAAGAGVVVLAAFTGVDGLRRPPGARRAEWKTLLANLDRIAARAAGARRRRLPAPAHRHHGRAGEEVDRVLAGSRVGLCVDTGHLAVGGADPVALTAAVRRPGHATCTSRTSTRAQADQVIAGDLAFGDAVKERHLPAARPGRRRHRRAGHATLEARRLPAAGTSSSRT